MPCTRATKYQPIWAICANSGGLQPSPQSSGGEAEGAVGKKALEGAFGGAGSDKGLEGFGELGELALVGGEAGEQEFGGLFGFGFGELWVDGLDEALGLV